LESWFICICVLELAQKKIYENYSRVRTKKMRLYKLVEKLNIAESEIVSMRKPKFAPQPGQSLQSCKILIESASPEISFARLTQFTIL
jgi:hypothetical protein